MSLKAVCVLKGDKGVEGTVYLEQAVNSSYIECRNALS